MGNYVDSITIAKPFNNTISVGRDTHKPNSISKGNPCKSLNSLDTGIGAISENRPAGFVDRVNEREVMKNEDHG